MAGERTMDVSGKYALSAGRISQMRRRFQDSWERFQHGPAPECDGGRTAVA